MQPRLVDASLRLEESLAQGFESLVITSTDNARRTRQAVLTSSTYGGSLTLNQVRSWGRVGGEWVVASTCPLEHGMPCLSCSQPPHPLHQSLLHRAPGCR